MQLPLSLGQLVHGIKGKQTYSRQLGHGSFMTLLPRSWVWICLTHKVFDKNSTLLMPGCCAVENLTDDNLEAVRQADHLEGQLMDEMEDRETDVSPWGILNRLSPLLFAWVSNQLIMLNDWSGRIQGTEDWKPVTHQRGCARLAALPLHNSKVLNMQAVVYCHRV